MSDDLLSRRRRAAYRATHRGTKEMDIALGRFAEAKLASMSEPALEGFERLLALPDPELQAMIWHPEAYPAGEFSELIALLRAFHGLGASGA
jgi:antitoxin CptB